MHNDSCLSSTERVQIMRWLEESEAQFLAAIDAVSAAQWTWKPSSGWSIGEAAEHVVLAEALLFGLVQRALATPPDTDSEEQTAGKADFIMRVMPSWQQGQAKAPDPLVPQGRFSPADVRERFRTERARIDAFARETELPLKRHTFRHPFPVFGMLNAYQWMVYLPLHTTRHAKQIQAIKATAGATP